MADSVAQWRTFVFKNRGTLLALPAVALVICGKPSRRSSALGLPLAVAGELLRCWAVGYSGTTTRADRVTAPRLVTAGPYAHVRNPLYVGNALTALGFSIAFTGGLRPGARRALIAFGLGSMAAVYTAIVPLEEAFLRREFGAPYEEYVESVPRLGWRAEPYEKAQGWYDIGVVGSAETRTFVTFGLMLLGLAVKALRR